MSEIRVLPMPHVLGKWEHDYSKYPETIIVSFSNGKTVKYRIDVQQPHPCFEAAIENIKNMEGLTIR